MLTNENDKFQRSLSRPSIIDARAHYWAAARRLRSPDRDYATSDERLMNECEAVGGMRTGRGNRRKPDPSSARIPNDLT
jgi:hypothetical protein